MSVTHRRHAEARSFCGTLSSRQANAKLDGAARARDAELARGDDRADALAARVAAGASSLAAAHGDARAQRARVDSLEARVER